MHKDSVLVLATVLLVASAHSVACGEGLDRLTLDDFEPIEYNADRLLVSGPSVIGFEGSKAIVEFETSVPTPAAVIHFGPITMAGDVREALFRKVARERLQSGETATLHHIEVDVSKLESSSYDLRYIEDGGGEVAYRVEVYDPRWGSGNLYDRLFRYTREGPRKTGEYAVALTMTFGPFVDLVGPDSFVISWETDVPAAGAVVLGDTVITDREVSLTHEVAVGGLRPDTDYRYRVRYGSDEVHTETFRARTAPEEGSGDCRFAYASDSRAGSGGGERSLEGVNHATFKAILADAVSKDVDLMLFGGDLVDGYTTSEGAFRSELDSWKRAVCMVAFSLPIYEGVGNHEQLGDYLAAPEPEQPDRRFIVHRDREGAESLESVFSSEFTNPTGSCYGFSLRPEERALDGDVVAGPDYAETVYSFNRGNCHFISVNTNYWFTGVMYDGTTVRYPSDKEGTALALRVLGGNREGYVLPYQLEWLEEDLAAAEADESIDWIFIFSHEPAFPNGGHLYDAMFWGEPGKGHEGGLNDPAVPLGDVIDMRNRFWGALAHSPKVVAFMCGDEHNYSRTLIDTDVNPGFAHPVWHIVSGGAGAPFYAQDRSVTWVDKVAAFAPVNHYCVFDADHEGVSLRAYAASGVLLDEVPDLTTYGSAGVPE
ncbi:MAG: metallophosphoesterase [Candidatus Eisenbacteria sp.]|nr:metallophosphoesterase [Candidatus Eisenbacteria bacterium]